MVGQAIKNQNTENGIGNLGVPLRVGPSGLATHRTGHGGLKQTPQSLTRALTNLRV
jgi:hypothetical protein